MQYSHLNDIPYVGLVDAGTVELVQSLGVEVVCSADLVQLFEARWPEAALASHLEAGKGVHTLVRQAFASFGRRGARGPEPIGEYDVQQEILRQFRRLRPYDGRAAHRLGEREYGEPALCA